MKSKSSAAMSGRAIMLLAPLAVLLAGAIPAAVAQERELTDQAISDKINDELMIDRGVGSYKVNVDTNNGVVTLSGSVNNILAEERAAAIASTVRGVRSVINRIEVTPTELRSDDDIQRDVETALLNDPATDSYEITTSVEDGTVTLQGTVESYQEKQLVAKVVKGVRGVTDLNNEVDVSYESDRPDEEIASEIRQALKWNRFIDGYMIEVSVNDGTVTLSGTVGSAAEKQMARRTAYVAGVDAVDTSELSVESWAREAKLRGDKYVDKSEEQIEQAVRDALMWDPRVMSFDVSVEAVGNAVTLRGEVDNLKAKRAAGQDARNTVGVVTVYNRIKVRPDMTLSDEQIASDVRDKFLMDPYVDRFDLTVDVINGTAHLYGTVDSRFEKNRADDLASRVIGVIEVENHLDVEEERTYLYDPYVDEGFVDETDLTSYDRRVPYMTDRQLKESIRSELWWSPFVDSDAVNVAVDDGVATLTGTVESWSEHRAATENAYEGGATLVDNEVVVQSD